MTALSDLRVLDLSTHVAGPFCTKLLADFGADVMKVEPPQGDPARLLGPFPTASADPEASAVFLYLNTNKRGITLNIDTDAGRTLLRELLGMVDIVVESFPVGTMARLGWAFSELEQLRPGIILTSITPFGQTGPWRDHQATDLIVHATSGLSAVNRLPGGAPLREPGFQTEYVGGVCAFLGTMSAVTYRDRHGVGQHVDLALQEAAATMIAPEITRVAYAQRSPGMRLGFLPCQDGYITLNIRSDQAWRDLWRFLGHPEGAADSRFQTVAARRANQAQMEEYLCSYLTRFTMEELFHGLQPQRILVGMALDMSRLVRDPHLQAREMFVEVEHPVAGTLTVPGPPFKMMQTPWQLRTPAPLLGQDNSAIYVDQLGHTPQELHCWQSQGIV
jgi:crotonobetainyl-CoA:carnitine CoA-transferase CaiB-like acyl-CoA transferase